MEKIISIIDSIAYEKGLKTDDVKDALKESFIYTVKKLIDPNQNFDARIDKDGKTLELFQKIEVVANDDPRLDGVDKKGNVVNKENFIALSEAIEIDKNVEIGDFLEYDIEFEDLGRSAVSMLYSNLEYRLQRLIEQNIFKKYKAKVGSIITSSITYIDQFDNTYMELGEVQAVLPKKYRIKGEKFKRADAVKAIVRSVKVEKQRLLVEVSRTSPNFLTSLLELEVPELKDGRINIEAVARIPGIRAKIAISTTEPNIDPIGAVVGVKGVRINAVSGELNGENIDCIDYSPIPEVFINRALSPAKVISVKILQKATAIENGKAIVKIDDEQKAKAIGKSGLNVRLATMLTKYDIEFEIVENKTENILAPKENNNDDNKDNISKLEALFK